MKISINSTKKNLIGGHIRDLRLANRLTQYQMAAKLQLEGYNFSELTILRIEKGQRLVTDVELKILCEFFGVSPNLLLDFPS